MVDLVDLAFPPLPFVPPWGSCGSGAKPSPLLIAGGLIPGCQSVFRKGTEPTLLPNCVHD